MLIKMIIFIFCWCSIQWLRPNTHPLKRITASIFGSRNCCYGQWSKLFTFPSAANTVPTCLSTFFLLYPGTKKMEVWYANALTLTGNMKAASFLVFLWVGMCVLLWFPGKQLSCPLFLQLRMCVCVCVCVCVCASELGWWWVCKSGKKLI
jgi:hypothetical protein